MQIHRVLLAAMLSCSLPALAEGAASASKEPPPARDKMLAAARDVARGYYDALIAKRYQEAAGFLHPSAIEPLKSAVLDDLEKGPPEKTKATLAALGVSDAGAVRTMTLDAFYVAWAKSPYGKGVQVLSTKEWGVTVAVAPPSCSVERKSCEVLVNLRGQGPDGEPMKAPNTVWVVEHEGRWLLMHKPPS